MVKMKHYKANGIKYYEIKDIIVQNGPGKHISYCLNKTLQITWIVGPFH